MLPGTPSHTTATPRSRSTLRHRERREHVAARAARHDEHGSATDRAALIAPPPGMRITAERELHLTS